MEICVREICIGFSRVVGLVASLNRPGGNVTGATSINLELGPKRLELMRELLPSVSSMALLVNPTTHLPSPLRALHRLPLMRWDWGCLCCRRAASTISTRRLQSSWNCEQAH